MYSVIEEEARHNKTDLVSQYYRYYRISVLHASYKCTTYIIINHKSNDQGIKDVNVLSSLTTTHPPTSAKTTAKTNTHLLSIPNHQTSERTNAKKASKK